MDETWLDLIVVSEKRACRCDGVIGARGRRQR